MWWLCACVTMWLCDCVTVWLCDCVWWYFWYFSLPSARRRGVDHLVIQAGAQCRCKGWIVNVTPTSKAVTENFPPFHETQYVVQYKLLNVRVDLQKHSPGLKILTSLGGQQSWSLIIPTLHALFLITGNDQLPPSYPQLTIVSTVPTQRPACQWELEMFVINFLLSSTGCISLIVCNVKVSRWCPGDVQVMSRWQEADIGYITHSQSW